MGLNAAVVRGLEALQCERAPSTRKKTKKGRR